MTELVTRDTTTVALPTVTGWELPGLRVLEEWASANEHAARLVGSWIFTDLVPVHHWPLPAGESLRTMPNPRLKHPRETDVDYAHRVAVVTASAAGTVLRGIPLGLPPHVALEQMHVIRGTVGMKVKLKYALALSRGIKAWDVESSDESVTVAGIHPTTGKTITITRTIAQARQAGWTTNEAYAKTPEDMLWARAMSRLLDRIAGHILFGLPSVEEIDATPDTYDTDQATQPAPATATSIIATVTGTAAADLGPLINGPTIETVSIDPPADGPITPKTRAAISARFEAAGINARALARRAAIVEALAGRPVARTADLTEGEGQSIVDNLTAEAVARIEGTDQPAPETQDTPTEPAGWENTP